MFSILPLRPHKSLGQVFLIERSSLSSCFTYLQAGSQRVILEIGAGLGQVTRPLLRTGAEVTALELDRRFLPTLAGLAEENARFHFHLVDAQKVSWDGFFPGPYSVFGNLPFFLSTALLEHLLEGEVNWLRAVFLLQEEVTLRLLAGPGEEGYGALSILAQLRAHLSPGPSVSRRCFHPIPRVDSAFLYLERLSAPRVSVPNMKRFVALVHGAFAQRRKTLTNNLLRMNPHLSRIQAASLLNSAGISEKRRGETLSLEEFARLAWALEAPLASLEGKP
ncbi:MAG: 16S rRNA (adenine(1518)-N(6)/adenine(1519)-N(6))-dimethyltransferase RsmA [bacterium]